MPSSTLSRRDELLQVDAPDALAAYIEGLGRRHALRLTARAERQRERDYVDA